MTRGQPTAGSTTWARYTPPDHQQGILTRPRLIDSLERATARHRVTVVCAPSGFGKTTVVSAWASLHMVAWLSLGPFDSDPTRLARSVVEALQTAAADIGLAKAAELRTIDARASSVSDVYYALCDAFAALGEPITLVVDDAQRAADTMDRNILGALIDSAPERLRLILVGTTLLEVSLSRLLVRHPDALIDASELAFDATEITQLMEGTHTDLTPAIVREETNGWPIAVRVMLHGGARPPVQGTVSPETIVRDYVRQHVLAPLPVDLRRVILDTTVAGEVSPELAVIVTGRHDAAGLLEKCAQIGMFLDRVATDHGTVYRWHSYFARQCRALLQIDDPRRLILIHRRIARALADTDPITAISHHLAAHDPDAAVRLITRRWIRLVLGTEAGPLEQLCATLPRTFGADPSILFIRACAQDVIGEHASARILFAQAQAATAAADAGDSTITLTQALASLILLDDRASVAAAIRRVIALSPELRDVFGQDRAWAMYLLAWTQMRLRSDPPLLLDLMTAALREAEAVGAHDLAARTRGHLALSLAWSGDFGRAHEALNVAADARGDIDDPSPDFAGGSAALAAAYIAYFRGDRPGTEIQSAHVIRSASGSGSFAGIARVLNSLAAAASGDTTACRRAAQDLQLLPRVEMHGWSWPAFRLTAFAALDEAAGHRDRALATSRRLEASTLPLSAVVLAGIHRRAGDPAAALRLLESLNGYEVISYVRVAVLATNALVRRRQGTTQLAHELCEHALDLAEAEGIRRPFCEHELELRQLLTAHIAWGTRHEDFIVDCLTSHAPRSMIDHLSEREREVFEQLRTTRTRAEIAQALGISLNTVKTHQQSLYRKLGVGSRREAIQLTT